jgi:hypothetical protein
MLRKTIAALFIMLMIAIPTRAQDGSPFILPLTDAPGPQTWLVGQFYGNTVDAYTYRRQWYGAGQGIHFGLDFFAPCGTPVVAVADGMIHAVDAPSFGADPHNVVLLHPQIGFSSVYGHLNETSLLVEGLPINQGDLVGYVGDPDGVCSSRPHLHFEIRSLDFHSAFNPIDYIDAPWQTLATIGPLNTPPFQRDLANPLQWMAIHDQPAVSFGGPYLNNYPRSFPPEGSVAPPANTPLARQLQPPDATSTWQAVQLTQDGCCPFAGWHPTDSNRFFTMEPNGINERDVQGHVGFTGDIRSERLSPDGTFRAFRGEGGVLVEDVFAQERWFVETDGVLPAISADNSRLLWQVADFLLVPGDDYPMVEIFSSNIDGSARQRIWRGTGAEAVWLDASRVLISTSVLDSAETTLTVFDTTNGQSYELGRWDWLRGLSVGPGGERLMFYLIWQADPTLNGVHSINTQPAAMPEKMPWFGGWRWRDAHSVYYVPFFVGWYNADRQVIAYYDIPGGASHYLTDINSMSITINSGDWSVSPDGSRILYRSATDNDLWLLVSASDDLNLP